MHQTNGERTKEIISMEEYLEKRQAIKRTESTREPENKRAATWKAALEIVTMYV